jgi:hypothetical protein
MLGKWQGGDFDTGHWGTPANGHYYYFYLKRISEWPAKYIDSAE